jgi:hypothetical protein
MPDPLVILRRLEIVDQRWRAAINESAYAPPDPGFADRIRSIAAAAEATAIVLHEAARTPRLRWKMKRNTTIGLTYELRPGGNRPGPADTWKQFDHAVAHIQDTQADTNITAQADAFRNLAITAMRLAGQIDHERAEPEHPIASAG